MVQAFVMFIAEVKHQKILILKRSFPTTSYVVATFHPTIGQCAPQSLSNNATPELGMIPQGISVKVGLDITKVTQKNQVNTVGFIRPSRS